ncbi:hypothetical protein D5086_012504 [Populus alba]|uniref:Uncharacterized protein n=1 Tax=Populus alba TaxID=43335 RepID=A0ACC4C348_POPAL
MTNSKEGALCQSCSQIVSFGGGKRREEKQPQRHVPILNAPPAKPSSIRTSPCVERCQRRSHHMKQAGHNVRHHSLYGSRALMSPPSSWLGEVR